MKIALTLALLTLAASPLAAQTVWRCGPDGRSFQATPCADGERLALRAAPAPGAVAEARAVAADEREALARLAAERRARERDAVERGLGPAGIQPRAEAPRGPGQKTGKKGAPAPTVTPW